MSGGLIPIQIVYGSSFLKGLSWANPFKYAVEPYLNQQGVFRGSGYALPSWADIGYPFIVVGLVLICATVITKKLKWAY
jgi:hypothetical protein